MSKFLGKFRQKQDYKDDYESMSSKKTKKKNEHGEIKKLNLRELNDGYEYVEEFYDEYLLDKN